MSRLARGRLRSRAGSTDGGSRRRTWWRALLVGGAWLCAASPAAAADATARIIVAREAGLTAAQRDEIRADARVALVGDVPLMPRTEIVSVPRDRVEDALDRLNADPGVRYAEIDAPVRAAVEPLESAQWALTAVRAVDAAGLGATGAGVMVAVVDTGVDLAHPDLASQIAGNRGESGAGRESNGRDDDGNGLVDDWRGWDWVANDNAPQDLNGHGTHVAGVVAAPRNGVGVAGVAPQATILPVRALDTQGAGVTSQVASALAYAGRIGAPIATASLGGMTGGQTLDAAMRAHPGTLYVAAAGNEGSNNDAQLSFPCNSTAVNVICVGATGRSDELAPFSNVGRRTVDLFAPGVDILSTFPGGYTALDGTSFAAPLVAGVAALFLGRNTGAPPPTVRNALLAGVDPLPGLIPLSVSGGRLNARRTLEVQPADRDGDGVGDVWDICVAAADPSQADVDADGAGDACDDSDGDGVPDAADRCPQQTAHNSTDGCPGTVDSDRDEFPDVLDRCPTLAAPGTRDGCPQRTPGGRDRDGDGRPDAMDPCPRIASRRRSGCPRPAIRRLSATQAPCARRSCHRVRVRLLLSRTATVRVELAQRRCRRGRCRWTRVDRAGSRLRRGRGTLTLAARRPGRTRVRAVARLGPERSRPRIQIVRLR